MKKSAKKSIVQFQSFSLSKATLKKLKGGNDDVVEYIIVEDVVNG